MNSDQLRVIVHNAIQDAKMRTCVIDLGITVDDITHIAKEDMMSIEKEMGCNFVCIGNVVLVKVTYNS